MAMAALTSMLAIAFFIRGWLLARPNSSCQRGLKIGSALIWAVSQRDGAVEVGAAGQGGRGGRALTPPPPPSRPLAASMMPASASCGNTRVVVDRQAVDVLLAVLPTNSTS